MSEFDGKWVYRSFRPERGRGDVPAQIAVPEAPPGTLTVTTDPETGTVSGTLDFGRGIALAISGSITPAGPYGPRGVELTGKGHSSLNRIRGFFIEGGAGPVIVGTVVAVHGDLLQQPDGTSGHFCKPQTGALVVHPASDAAFGKLAMPGWRRGRCRRRWPKRKGWR
jgi:hypothetical protein